MSFRERLESLVQAQDALADKLALQENASHALHQSLWAAGLAVEAHDLMPMGCTWEEVGEHGGRRGADGSAGSSREDEVVERQATPVVIDWKDGAVICSQTDFKNLAGGIDSRALDLMVLSVENDFRRAGNKLDAELVAKIEFLLAVTSAIAETSQTARELLARTFAMSKKASLGLDFYGYTVERVPSLSFEIYTNGILPSVLARAREIERSFFEYWDSAQSAEARRSQLRISIGSGAALVQELSQEYSSRTQEARAQLAALPALEARVEVAKAVLMLKRAELDSAIKSKHAGCDLIGAIVSVGTIVAGVASGGAGFVTAASAGAKLYGQLSAEGSSLSTLWDDRSLVQKNLEDVSKGATTVVESISKIRDAVGKLTPEERRLPQFVMEREQFDKVAKDFADIPEAAVYRDAGYDFLKSIETRNQAIVDYNASLAQLIELEARVLGSRRAVTQLRDRLNAGADPAEALIVTLMSRLYLDSLDSVASFVHRAKKAFGYLFCEYADASISALNVSELDGEFIRLQRAWAETKERNRLRQQVAGLEIPLHEIVSPEAWAAFLSSGRLCFTVSRDHASIKGIMSSLPGLRVTSVRINMPGAKAGPGQDQIPWSMFHGGSELVFPSPSTRIDDGGNIEVHEWPAVGFSRLAFLFRGTTSISGQEPIVNADISEGDLYAGLSPYAAWMFSVDPTHAMSVDLNSVSKLTLTVGGYIVN